MFAFALVTPDEQSLQDLSFKLFMEGIPHKCIFEPDAPWTGQLMAIGVFPGPRKKLRKYFSNLPLLK
jgi:hypothetical protein